MRVWRSLSGCGRGTPPGAGRRRGRRAPGVCLLMLLEACSTASRPLPDLPQPALESFVGEAREQAVKALEEAKASPRDPGASGRLGEVLHAYDQFGAAAQAYGRARALDPEEFRWAYLLGVVQAAAGNNDEAAASLREAVRRDPRYVPARLKLAEALLALGRFRESRGQFEALAARNPEVAAAHYGLGRVLAAEGDLAGAVRSYRRACELAPGFGAAHYALALAYQKLGESDRAREEMALYRQNPLGAPPVEDVIVEQVKARNRSALYHLKLGVSLEASGRIQESIAAHEKAVQADPKLIQAHMNLITLYAKAGDPDKAAEHYRATLALNPNVPESHYNYGVMLFERGRRREAAAAFRRALEINPRYAEARGNLAYILMIEGRLAEAEQQYRAALAAQPNYRLGHFQLGRLLLNRGRTAEAIEHFRQTLGEEGPALAGYLYALGAAYGRAGRRDQAMSYLRQARDKAAAAGQTQLLAGIERDLRTVEQGR